jgi:hypothetical protein
MFYKNYLAMKNTAEVKGGKPFAIWLKSISGVSAVGLLVTFYDTPGRKGEELFYYAVQDIHPRLLYTFSYLLKTMH